MRVQKEGIKKDSGDCTNCGNTNWGNYTTGVAEREVLFFVLFSAIFCYFGVVGHTTTPTIYQKKEGKEIGCFTPLIPETQNGNHFSK